MENSVQKTATTSYPIMTELAERWSPRAFDSNYELSEQELGSMLEAARWAPSSNNTQPWQFVVAKRGTPLFDQIHETLAGFNQVWTPWASALIVNVVELESEEGKPLRHGLYDLGQAAAHLSIQAAHMGLHVHQMSGFDGEALRQVLGLGERFSPSVMMAVGKIGDPAMLPEGPRERELLERTRKPLAEVAPGTF
jgi:nitroreductase